MRQNILWYRLFPMTRIRGERIMNTKVLRRMEFLIVLLIIEQQCQELL